MSDKISATTDKKPAPQADIINIHTLSVMVNNQPGVLGRICAVFSRRASPAKTRGGYLASCASTAESAP